MSEENPNPQPDISSQFRELGENIKNFFHSASTQSALVFSNAALALFDLL